ncbi:MAG: dephospho-CoA kinase [Ancalomicrobiaceae bacterium]|nr:dephospho-CoA kinase [Ancalomicrobiaceae bacterium]
MIRLGLTGSIGMGKSTTAAMFARVGVPVYDADATVHALYRGAAAPLIEAAFPGTVRDGVVVREELAKRVLGRPEALARLEAIVHPLAEAAEAEFLAEAAANAEPIVVLDIPLLFEVGAERRVDKVVVVSAPAEMQRARVLDRAGMTEERLSQILSRQVPDEEKRRRADFIVDTSRDFAEAEAQVRAILDVLKTTAPA